MTINISPFPLHFPPPTTSMGIILSSLLPALGRYFPFRLPTIAGLNAHQDAPQQQQPPPLQQQTRRAPPPQQQPRRPQQWPPPPPPQPPQPPAPPPPPTLETLPVPEHGLIGEMFAGGDRYLLALLSTKMRELHGGTLTTLEVKWKASHRVMALAPLLRKQRRLEKVVVGDPGALPALIVVLTLRTLSSVQELSVAMSSRETTAALGHVQALVGAFQVGGPLPALQVLRLLPAMQWQPGMLPALAEALSPKLIPSLHTLDIKGGPFADEDLEALSAMLELRAQRPGYLLFNEMKAVGLMDPNCSEAACIRLLRALLPSATHLEDFVWGAVYEACFVGRPAPLFVVSYHYEWPSTFCGRLGDHARFGESDVCGRQHYQPSTFCQPRLSDLGTQPRRGFSVVEAFGLASF